MFSSHTAHMRIGFGSCLCMVLIHWPADNHKI